MAAHTNTENLQALWRDQLWQAHMPPNTATVDVFDAEDQSVGVLTAYGSEKYIREPTLNTPFAGNDRFRWLAHAVFREGGAFQGDVEYDDIVSSVERAGLRAMRLKDTELAGDLNVVKTYTGVRLLQRTRANLGQLNRFINEQGNIHMGFGMAGVPEFQVARLVKVAASPADDAGRRKPLAIIQGKDGAIGTKPLYNRARREIFVGRIDD